jgi:putative salt-induced outer membrane protein YdiY
MALGAGATGAGDLDLSVNDVFPTTRSDLGFTEDPNAVLLAQASTDATPKGVWDTAIPPTDKFDWVQTTSGEWLKGELKEMYSGSLSFDSDEFDLQSIDWDDVEQFHGTGEKRISIDGPDEPEIYIGELTVTKDKVIIETADGKKEFPRSKLIAITQGATSEWDNWSAKISIGLNFTRGNSTQTDYTSKLNVKRLTPDTRFVVDYLGNISENSNAQTVNNHRLNTFFDMFLAKEYFFRPVFAEFFKDKFQNIDYRATIGIGGGYHIIDTPKTTWDVSGGPGYRRTRYISVAPGDSQNVDTPALVFGTFYDTALTKTVDFNANYNASIVNQASGTYTHHAIATFEIELTSILDFDVSFVWDRTQDPQVRSDGTTPKQDDFQLLLTLGVDI